MSSSCAGSSASAWGGLWKTCRALPRAFAASARGRTTWRQPRSATLSSGSSRRPPGPSCASCATASPTWKNTSCTSISWRAPTSSWVRMPIIRCATSSACCRPRPKWPGAWCACGTCAPKCSRSSRAKDERDHLRKMADEALELAKFSIAFAKENVFPKYLDVVKSLGVITSGFIGTVKDNGALNLYNGKLRLMASDGSFDDFPYDRYTEFIGEHIEPWSYL